MESVAIHQQPVLPEQTRATAVAPAEVLPAARDAKGRFLPGTTVGISTRWNSSGNPAGTAKLRLQFERAFYEALMGEGTPEEAAKLLWSAAREKQPWAIQLLLQRLAPQATQVRLTHEVDNGGIDLSRLSNDEIQQIEGILERAALAPPVGEGGEGAAQPT